MRKKLCSLFMLIFLSGCIVQSTDGLDETLPMPETKKSKYLFAVVYKNASWGRVNKGLVIRDNGDLYLFDVASTNEDVPDRDIVYEAELTRYFEAAKYEFKQSLNNEEVEKLWDFSKGVDNKTLGATENICKDAGSYQYYIFQNIDSQRISKATIYRTGDFRQVQNDVRAKPVKELLVKLALENKIAWRLEPNGDNWCTGM